jgi:hypothetical protein
VLTARVDRQQRSSQGGGRPTGRGGGHGRDGEAARDLRVRAILHQWIGVGPVPHQHRLAVLKREAHLLLLPGEHGFRYLPVIDGPFHRRERADRRLRVHPHRSLLVEDPAPVSPQILEEDRHQSLVASALPDEGVGQPRSTGDPARHVLQLRKGGGRRFEQIRSPVEETHVDEPGERVEPGSIAAGGQGSGEEVARIRLEALEGEDPSGRREFGGPDHVELQDVRISDTRVEPLDVELVPLIRGVGRGPTLDANPRMLVHEALQLASQQLSLGTHRTSRKADHHPSVAVGAAGEDQPRQGNHRCEIRERQVISARTAGRRAPAP